MTDTATPTAPPRDIKEEVFNAGLELEGIVHLDYQTVPERLDSDLNDLLHENVETLAAVLECDLDDLRNEVKEYGWSETLNMARRPLGWLLTVTVPTYEDVTHGDHGPMARVNMSCRHMQTVHAATYDEAVDKALAWAEEQRAADYAKNVRAA